MTLILVFHPDLAASQANRALADAARELPGIQLIDMAGLYPDGRIDVEAEAARLMAADRLVLQFPVQWYSTPPLLKAWQDAVLTRMVYLAPASEGAKLQGMPLPAIDQVEGDALVDLRGQRDPRALLDRWLAPAAARGEADFDFADGLSFALSSSQRWRIWRRPLPALSA